MPDRTAYINTMKESVALGSCIDKEKFAELMQAGEGRFYRIAFCYVKNEHDALDIVSEATCKGLKSLGSLKNPAYFNTWMTRIIINTAVDMIRKESRCVTAEDIPPDIQCENEQSLSPEDSMDLYDALESLNAKEKTCIILRFFEEYSFKEIASVLKETETTVKSRVYRALNKMKLFLGQED